MLNIEKYFYQSMLDIRFVYSKAKNNFHEPIFRIPLVALILGLSFFIPSCSKIEP